MNTQDQLKIYRNWQKKNPEWELCCDIKDANSLYTQWEELTEEERKNWAGVYNISSKEGFNEFAIKKMQS